MTKPRKHRISTTPNCQTLHNPFAQLQIQGLPPGNDPAPATQNPGPPARPKLGRVVLRRETAHRGGKTVVVVDDFATHLSGAFIEELCKRLRKVLGCGGTTKNRSIEIQGDQPERVRSLLEQEGFRVAGVR